MASPGWAGSIRETARLLQGVPDTDGDALPESARPLIAELKHAMLNEVCCSLRASAGTQSVSDRVPQWIASQIPHCDTSRCVRDSRYGCHDGVVIEVLPGEPQRLIVTVSVSVECGADSSVWLLERVPAGWRLITLWDPETLTERSQAWWVERVVLGSPASDGSRYAVAAGVEPQCSSAWHGLDYRVLRFGPGSPRATLAGRREVDGTSPEKGAFEILAAQATASAER